MPYSRRGKLTYAAGGAAATAIVAALIATHKLQAQAKRHRNNKAAGNTQLQQALGSAAEFERDRDRRAADIDRLQHDWGTADRNRRMLRQERDRLVAAHDDNREQLLEELGRQKNQAEQMRARARAIAYELAAVRRREALLQENRARILDSLQRRTTLG